jgi:hypothetical protein
MSSVVDERASLLSTRDDARRRLVAGVVAGVATMIVTIALALGADGRRTLATGEWRGVRGKLLPRAPEQNERAGPNGPTRTFTVYDHCLSDVAREEGFARDFWTSPRAGARIVRHNYETSAFFEYDDGVELSRVEIADGLYAWKATTTRVDWEFGFALANDAGQQFYDIGAWQPNQLRNIPPLAVAGETCVQKYGAYFNRVMTQEVDPSNVSYVFGTCERECAPGYQDTAFTSQPLSAKLASPATDPNAKIDLGESRDARLIVPQTIMFYADSQDRYVGINPHLRTGMQKDGDFAESRNAVRWIVGGIDYWRMYLKMAKIEIFLEDGRAKMKFISQKRHSLDSNKGYPYRTKGNDDWRVNNYHVVGCTNVYCDPTQYDLTTLYRDSTNVDMQNYVVQALQYKSLKVGDSAPTSYSLTTGIQSEPNCRTLRSGITCTAAQQAASHFLEGTWGTGANAERTLFAAGRWGPDIDVRRLIVKSGVLCSRGQNMEHCMYAVAVPFNPGSSAWKGYSGPTKTRKQWILTSLVGAGWKMARVEIFVDDAGALKIKALDSALDNTNPASDFDHNTGDALIRDMSQHYRTPTHSQGPYRDWNDDTSGLKMGVGGLYYELAGTMVPSLAGFEPPYVLPL